MPASAEAAEIVAAGVDSPDEAAGERVGIDKVPRRRNIGTKLRMIAGLDTVRTIPVQWWFSRGIWVSEVWPETAWTHLKVPALTRQLRPSRF